MLKGTWTSLEVYKALEKGYKVVRLVEVWHYEKWAQYDGKDDEAGLFTRYINCFLKQKTQATGLGLQLQETVDVLGE